MVAAWLPSLPMIPIPMEAVYIIFTSLAPSPIARVNASLSSITNFIISALSLGDDRYTIIEDAC